MNDYKVTEKLIEGRMVRIVSDGDDLPIFIFPTSQKGYDSLEDIYNAARQLGCERGFSIAAFVSDQWNDDYSPWAWKGFIEGESFGGNGVSVLCWIENALIPVLRDFLAFSDIYILGYSLAGLFSLWSVYESQVFDGCGCCSGSMWFNGWLDYASEHSIGKEGAVYLSLGGKEEKTSDPVMASIGNATRQMDKILEKDTKVIRHKLEMNPGGHFSANEKRIAKAICWLISDNKR